MHEIAAKMSAGVIAPRAIARSGSGQLPLAVEKLGFTADGRAILEDVSFHFGGGTLAIMGPNGAGKSVLLRLLHGLLAPTGGTVSWNGAIPGDTTRRGQALVFQRPVLLRRSAAANVDFVLALRGRSDAGRREALLARVGLAGRGGEPARRLSGGEQQRLALARALAIEPRVLLLDEPTASLDPSSTLAIERIVAEARADGVGVVWVTHDIGQARRMASEVVFLSNGRLREHTPASTFFEAPTSPQAREFLQGGLVL